MLTSTKRLVGVHPNLIEKVTKILAAMEILGFPMMVTDGLRTTARQQELYAQGRLTPGKIVTYADGIKNRSNHQAHIDGYGHAVDCCFLADLDGDGQVDDPTWDEQRPWELYGTLAKALGLTWGGDWKRPDKPHIEFP